MITFEQWLTENGHELNEKYVGFDKLKKSIAAKGGVKDAAATAAVIGRKKYGKGKFQKAAAKGRKMRGVKPKKMDAEKDSRGTEVGRGVPPAV